jgi:hypothetical protein
VPGRQQPGGRGTAGSRPEHGQQAAGAFLRERLDGLSDEISPDPLLIDKIRDVVGLYLALPANAVVFSVDESGRAGARHHLK